MIYSKDLTLENKQGFIIIYKNKSEKQGLSETLESDSLNISSDKKDK